MKKLLAILLVFVMILSLAACGSDKTEDDTKTPTTEQTENVPTTPSENEGDNQEPTETIPSEGQPTMRENGQYPEDKADLTDEERKYIEGELYDKVLQAVIDLDMDVLREYTGSQYLNGFEAIYADEDFREMYKNTVGTFVYLKESKRIAIRDTEYVFAKWHTSLMETNSVIPGDEDDLTKEEVDAIYEAFYKNAPMTLIEVKKDCFYLSDGYVKFNTDFMFHDADMPFSLMTPNKGFDNPYARLIFAEEAKYLSPDGVYKTLAEDKDYINIFYNKDLDAAQAYLSNEAFATTSYVNSVLKVLNDEAKKSALQEWINEHCETIVTCSSGFVYTHLDTTKINLKSVVPFHELTDADLATANTFAVAQSNLISDGERDFAYVWYRIIDAAEASGVFSN